MLAFVKERIGSITVDDILKEMVLRKLPTDISRTIHKAKDLDGAETAKLADQYFDKNSKPIHKAQNNPVNAVTKVPESAETEDDDVNTIGGRHMTYVMDKSRSKFYFENLVEK